MLTDTCVAFLAARCATSSSSSLVAEPCCCALTMHTICRLAAARNAVRWNAGKRGSAVMDVVRLPSVLAMHRIAAILPLKSKRNLC